MVYWWTLYRILTTPKHQAKVNYSSVGNCTISSLHTTMWASVAKSQVLVCKIRKKRYTLIAHSGHSWTHGKQRWDLVFQRLLLHAVYGYRNEFYRYNLTLNLKLLNFFLTLSSMLWQNRIRYFMSHFCSSLETRFSTFRIDEIPLY